jgi:hypothetical protein
LAEQLREPRVIRSTSRSLPVWQNPFRVLREKRVMDLPLKFNKAGDVKREI